MPNRIGYLGDTARGGDQVGSVRAFTVDPGAKWGKADGSLIQDTGVSYPALARAIGVAWFGDEQSTGFTFPPHLDGKVNPADGSTWQITGTGLQFFKTADNGDTWTNVGYAHGPAETTGGYGNIILIGHSLGNGIHVCFHVRQNYYDNGSETYDDRYFFVHRTANAGVSFQVSPTFNAAFDNSNYVAQPMSIDFSPTLGLFVLVTYGGRIYTSADGLAWTLRHTATFNAFNVRWIPKVGRFYVTGNGVNAFRHSADGINWTAANLPSGTASAPLEYPGGVLMPGGLFKSADGLTWSQVVLPTLQVLDPGLGLSGSVTVTSAAGNKNGLVLWLSHAGGNYFYSTADFVTFMRGSPVSDTLANEFFCLGKYVFKQWYGSRRVRLRSGLRKPKCDPIGGKSSYLKLKD